MHEVRISIDTLDYAHQVSMAPAYRAHNYYLISQVVYDVTGYFPTGTYTFAILDPSHGQARGHDCLVHGVSMGAPIDLFCWIDVRRYVLRNLSQ